MCGIFAYAGSSVDKKTLEKAFNKIKHRGPDASASFKMKTVYLGFHRLALMDQTAAGMQPFRNREKWLLCNGEIYNHNNLRQKLSNKYASSMLSTSSDCAVIIPAIEHYGLETACQVLDGEFAFVIYDEKTQTLRAARDPLGIRPLFYGLTEQSGEIAFASEAKALSDFCQEVKPFPIGSYFDGKQFHRYHQHEFEARHHQTSDIMAVPQTSEEAARHICSLLEDAVKKRLEADAPLGFLLSGGLDSSLVCALAAARSTTPIKTFAIGIEGDAIDTRYARDVAEFIGSDHTEVIFTKKQVRECLPKVIKSIESYDITTVRASVGMYLICEYIRSHTPIKALLTGEVSDELFGYKYTDFAPDANSFQVESIKRVTELFYYDVLRADRCLAAHSLEARVPFSDQKFVDYVLSIPPELKMNHHGIGKYLLRLAFQGKGLLPDHILMREKAAFSDAVGHSMVDELKAFAEVCVSNEELATANVLFSHSSPISKESYLYRQIFENHYKNMEKLIPGFWLPNQSWENCKVDDPSARVLPNYGLSGT